MSGNPTGDLEPATKRPLEFMRQQLDIVIQEWHKVSGGPTGAGNVFNELAREKNTEHCATDNKWLGYLLLLVLVGTVEKDGPAIEAVRLVIAELEATRGPAGVEEHVVVGHAAYHLAVAVFAREQSSSSLPINTIVDLFVILHNMVNARPVTVPPEETAAAVTPAKLGQLSDTSTKEEHEEFVANVAKHLRPPVDSESGKHTTTRRCSDMCYPNHPLDHGSECIRRLCVQAAGRCRTWHGIAGGPPGPQSYELVQSVLQALLDHGLMWMSYARMAHRLSPWLPMLLANPAVLRSLLVAHSQEAIIGSDPAKAFTMQSGETARMTPWSEAMVQERFDGRPLCRRSMSEQFAEGCVFLAECPKDATAFLQQAEKLSMCLPTIGLQLRHEDAASPPVFTRVDGQAVDLGQLAQLLLDFCSDRVGNMELVAAAVAAGQTAGRTYVRDHRDSYLAVVMTYYTHELPPLEDIRAVFCLDKPPRYDIQGILSTMWKPVEFAELVICGVGAPDRQSAHEALSARKWCPKTLSKWMFLMLPNVHESLHVYAEYGCFVAMDTVPLEGIELVRGLIAAHPQEALRTPQLLARLQAYFHNGFVAKVLSGLVARAQGADTTSWDTCLLQAMLCEHYNDPKADREPVTGCRGGWATKAHNTSSGLQMIKVPLDPRHVNIDHPLMTKTCGIKWPAMLKAALQAYLLDDRTYCLELTKDYYPHYMQVLNEIAQRALLSAEMVCLSSTIGYGGAVFVERNTRRVHDVLGKSTQDFFTVYVCFENVNGVPRVMQELMVFAVQQNGNVVVETTVRPNPTSSARKGHSNEEEVKALLHQLIESYADRTAQSLKQPLRGAEKSTGLSGTALWLFRATQQLSALRNCSNCFHQQQQAHILSALCQTATEFVLGQLPVDCLVHFVDLLQLCCSGASHFGLHWFSVDDDDTDAKYNVSGNPTSTDCAEIVLSYEDFEIVLFVQAGERACFLLSLRGDEEDTGSLPLADICESPDDQWYLRWLCAMQASPDLWAYFLRADQSFRTEEGLSRLAGLYATAHKFGVHDDTMRALTWLLVAVRLPVFPGRVHLYTQMWPLPTARWTPDNIVELLKRLQGELLPVEQPQSDQDSHSPTKKPRLSN